MDRHNATRWHAIPGERAVSGAGYCKILPHRTFHAAFAAHYQNPTMAMYESEITQFLKSLKQERPALETEQREGRALLWDKEPIDLEERARAEASRVSQKPYVYSLDN